MWRSTSREQCVLGEFGVEMTKGFMPHEVTLCLSFGVLQEGTLERLLGYLRSKSRLKFSRWDLWLHSCSSASSCHSGYLFHLKSGTLCLPIPKGHVNEWFYHNTTQPHRGNLPYLWGPKPCGVTGLLLGKKIQKMHQSVCVYLHPNKHLCGCFCLNGNEKTVEVLIQRNWHTFLISLGGQSTFCWRCATTHFPCRRIRG